MRISPAESQIMEVLWSRNPLTSDEITAELSDSQGWAAGTVKTLLNRLLNKKAVSAERQGRWFHYRPLIERAEYVRAESQGLLDRLFDGKVPSLVAYFSEREALSAEDVAELKRLIEKLG